MRAFCKPTLTLLAASLLITAGCYFPVSDGPAYRAEPRPGYASIAYVPTSLVVVVEGECTEAEYQARRTEIVNYLIERGYIAREEDLIGDPASAQRVIRAIVSSGGFTLSVFNQNPASPPPESLEFSDILYPADPYFILGFYYVDEIGPRHLPPRPHDYRPHPRPPHDARPPTFHLYDRDRHWSDSHQPDHRENRRVPPPDRHVREPNQPPLSQPQRPPEPAQSRKPDEHGKHPHPNDRTPPTPQVAPPGPADHPRSGGSQHVAPTPVPPRSPDRAPAPGVDRRPNGNPPPGARPPAQPVQPRPAPPPPPPPPEKSNDADRRDPSVSSKENHVQQN